MEIAVRFSNGMGNTINLTPLLASLTKSLGKPVHLIPKDGVTTSGADLIPTEICDVRIGSNGNYKIIVDPQAYWPNWKSTSIHEVDFYLSFINGKDQVIKDLYCSFDDSIFSKEFKDRKRITIINGCNANTGYNWERKLWPFFSEFVEILKNVYPEVEICKVGFPTELTDVSCTDYTNKNYSLLQTAGVIKHSNLVIANDTGLMHVADALKIPTIALFGSTPIGKNGPYQTKHVTVKSRKLCAPCMNTTFWSMCKKLDCMSFLKVEDVLNKTLKFVSKEGIFKSDEGYSFLYGEKTK